MGKNPEEIFYVMIDSVQEMMDQISCGEAEPWDGYRGDDDDPLTNKTGYFDLLPVAEAFLTKCLASRSRTWNVILASEGRIVSGTEDPSGLTVDFGPQAVRDYFSGADETPVHGLSDEALARAAQKTLMSHVGFAEVKDAVMFEIAELARNGDEAGED